MAKYKIGKITGPAGPVGPAGPGLPVGGVAGQILAKASATNYDTKWVEPASNPNLLDNWYFVNPINQRGQKEYTGSAYGIDRWKGSVSIESGYIKAKNFIIQALENPIFNVQLTFSVLLYNGGLLDGTASIPSSNNDRISFYVSNDSVQLLKREGTNNEFMIWSNNEIDIIAAKLELGDQQTLAHQDASGNWVLNDPPPDPALELLKCQRYQRLCQDDTLCYGGIGVNNIAYFSLPLSVAMRANPSIIPMEKNSIVVRCRTIAGIMHFPISEVHVHSLFHNQILLKGPSLNEVMQQTPIVTILPTILLDANL